MAQSRTCHVCGTVTDTWCPVCLAAFAHRPAVAAMTVDERVAELADRLGPVEIPFNLISQRIGELMGRPVWTHELVDGEALAAELRRGRPLGPDAVLGKLAAVGSED